MRLLRSRWKGNQIIESQGGLAVPVSFGVLIGSATLFFVLASLLWFRNEGEWEPIHEKQIKDMHGRHSEQCRV